MDDKRKELVGRTNIDQLLGLTAREIDLNQPVQARQDVADVQIRSTTDPQQIHFATTDVIGKLQEPAASSRMRAFALVFIGGPMIVFGLMLIGMALSSDVSLLRRLLVSVLGGAMAAFWPFLIYRGRRRSKG